MTKTTDPLEPYRDFTARQRGESNPAAGLALVIIIAAIVFGCGIVIGFLIVR